MRKISATVENKRSKQKRGVKYGVTRFVLRFFGWLLAIIGGMLTVVSTICALAALFGGLETSSFGEQLGFFALYLALAAASFMAVRLGLRLKGPSGSHAAPHKAVPQPTPEQRRLQEIEQDVDDLTGAIQANPMSRGAGANTERIKQLNQEKTQLLVEMADHHGQITVQDAWNTFPPEQQERFAAQRYQYTQDTGRDGRTPEDAAAIRGLVFVDGKPVPKEVAKRLDEMRQAVSREEAKKQKQRQEVTDCAECIQHGKTIYMSKTPYTGLNNRPYAEDALPQTAKYILAEERFISGHDDTAGFVELIDGDERVVQSWKFDYPMVKRFSQPDYYDDDCLVAYLRETYKIPAVGCREPEEKGPSKPRQGRPEGPVTVIRQLQFTCDSQGAVYSFEKKVQKVETVQNARQKFVCLSRYHCVAGANGRPDAHLAEDYYAIADSAEAEITAENWREKVCKIPDYSYSHFGNDVLY